MIAGKASMSSGLPQPYAEVPNDRRPSLRFVGPAQMRPSGLPAGPIRGPCGVRNPAFCEAIFRPLFLTRSTF